MSGFDWWDGVAIVLASLSLGWNVLQYLRPLRVECDCLEVTQLSDNRYLALFHLWFWNPSSEVKVLRNIGCNLDRRLLLTHEVIGPSRWVHAESKDVLILVDEKGDEVGKLPRDECFESGKGIPPRQSQGKYVPLLLDAPADGTIRDWMLDISYRITFVFYGPNRRCIAMCPTRATLRQLTTNGSWSLD